MGWLSGDKFHRKLMAKGKGAKGWANRHCHVEYLGNRKFRLTTQIGPRAVKHYKTREYVEFAYVENPDFASEKNCRVFAQNAHCAVEIYDYYAKLFNPDYETVSVHDERFVVQYLSKEKPEIWRDVGVWNPRIQVIPLEDGVEIKKTFDTDYGTATLEISYIIRTGAFLKHKIIFTNKTADVKTFRVVMKLAGITNNKVKHRDGEEWITAKKHIISPFLLIGEDNQHLKLTEYLWSLGITPEEPEAKWSPTTLKDIIFDVHTQGCKADIIIGNYTLGENESLDIDPMTSTWQVDVGSDDCYLRLGETPYFRNNDIILYCGDYSSTLYDYRSGIRFTNISIPQGATINSAHLKLKAWGYNLQPVDSIIKGEASDNAATFTDAADFQGRPRTTASVNWTPTEWIQGNWYDSPDISSVIQEIINRDGWSSGNALVLFWTEAEGFDVVDRTYTYSYERGAADAPKLEVTYTVPAPPTPPKHPTTHLDKGPHPRSRMTFYPRLGL